jgi:predicted HicB family RNase H-like nuclease
MTTDNRSAKGGRQAYVEFVGSDERIPVPDDPAGERAAVAAHPAYQRRLAEARQADAEGRSIPIEQVFQQLEGEFDQEASAPIPKRSRRGRPPQGEFRGRFVVRVPASLHRDLSERAEREHTTLNQLVLSYLSRGLGQDEGAAAQSAASDGQR